MDRTAAVIIIVAICFAVAGCGTRVGSDTNNGNGANAAPGAKTSNEADLDPENAPVLPGTPDKEDNRPILVAFGDSLTEGAGVDPAQSYPAKLQARIDSAGHGYRVVNAGVGGETTSQGLNRTEAIAALNPAIVIVEFGANDGLRGIPAGTIYRNLEAIVTRLQSAGALVVLAGMEVPPNYGAAYTRAFRNIFLNISKERKVPLIPFFLEGVGGHAELNQSDGIHPTAEGYDVVVENVWKVLEPLLRPIEP